jgi:hypothetical protein
MNVSFKPRNLPYRKTERGTALIPVSDPHTVYLVLKTYKRWPAFSNVRCTFFVIVTVTMVLLRYWTALVASTVVVPVLAAPTNKTTLPSLLDATIDELASGLDSGSFSSVDLVKVSTTLDTSLVAVYQLLICQGLRRAYSRSQRHAAHGHRAKSRCLGNRPRVGSGESRREM